MLFLLIIDLYFLNSAVISKLFNPTAELEIPIKIPIKEAKEEIEIEPGTAEIKIANV